MSNVIMDLMAKLSLDASSFENGLDKAKGSMGAVGNGLSKAFDVGIKAVAGASAAVGAFAASSVSVGMDFDKSMSQVAATMGMSMEEMRNQVGSVDTAYGTFSGNLEEYAQFMGENTAFSAKQASDALNYMALAGYDVQTSMAMLPNVLNLAAAGDMDLARASDMVTDTQTAFGISMERTNQMVDEMAKAASTGNTSVEQLGDAFLTVGGLAQELNGGIVTLSDGTTQSVDGIQELEIALTAMANAGIKGSEAGTHMRNMLLKLSSPTSDGVKQLNALGVSVFDSEGKMRSLKDIMGDLGGALGNLTQEEKIQAISDLFNTRDLASAEALLNAVGEDWDEIGESILNSKGAADKMAKTQLDNLAGDVTLFQSALEGAQIALSDKLEPALRGFVQMGIAELGGIKDAIKSGDWSGVFDSLKEKAKSGIELISQGITEYMPTMIENGLQMLLSLSEGLRSGAGQLVDVGIDLLMRIADGLIAGLPAMIETIPQIIINIAGIINDNAPKLLMAGAQLVVKLVMGIIDAIPTLVANIPKIFEAILAVWSALNWISLGGNIIKFISKGAKKLGTEIPKALKEIGGKAVEAFKGISWGALGGSVLRLIVTGLTSLAHLIVNALVSIASAAFNAFTSINWLDLGAKIISGIINGILFMAGTALSVIVEFIASVVTAIAENLPMIIETVAQFFAGVFESLGGFFSEIGSSIAEFFGGLISSVSEFFGGIFSSFGSFVSGMMSNIISWLAEVLSTVGSNLMQLLSNVGSNLSNLFNTVVQWISQIPPKMAYYANYAVTEFVNFVSQLPGKAWSILQDVIAKVVAFAVDFVAKAQKAAQDFFDEMSKKVGELPAELMRLGGEMVDAFKDLPDKFLKVGDNIVQGLWKGIKDGWDWLTQQVENLVDDLVKAAEDALGIASPSKVFKQIGRYVDQGFAIGLEDDKYLVANAIDNVVGVLDDAVYDLDSDLEITAKGNANGRLGMAGNAGYTQIINITSPQALSPYEVARQTRNATRNMVLAMSRS